MSQVDLTVRNLVERVRSTDLVSVKEKSTGTTGTTTEDINTQTVLSKLRAFSPVRDGVGDKTLSKGKVVGWGDILK
jgi:hypothetical protein